MEHTRPAKRLHNYGKPPFLMGKSIISMAMFHSYGKLPEGNGKNTPKCNVFSIEVGHQIRQISGSDPSLSAPNRPITGRYIWRYGFLISQLVIYPNDSLMVIDISLPVSIIY